MVGIRNRMAKFSVLALLLIYGVTGGLRFQNPPVNPISWDVFGYYLYLPLTFIYHDPGLKHEEIIDTILDRYHSSATFYQATRLPNGNWIMKYSMGMAALYSPAFFAGGLAAKVLGFPADGFSKPYQTSLVIYSILIAFLGLFVLRKFLLHFFSDSITAAILLLLFFGTNYFANAVYSEEMPHNYLFTLYALILWQTYRWHGKHKWQNMFWLAFFIGLAALARPTEIVALAIPFFWGVKDKKSLKEKIRLLGSYRKQVFLFIGVLLVIGSAQMIYWKIYSGHFIFYSYINPGEGFDFLRPHTLKFLFSFRKGWLIYTPMMVFAIWGFVYLYKEKKELFFSLFIFFLFNLYVVSSWSNWWYASSFGQRAVVQSYAVMAIPLGCFLNNLNRQNHFKKMLFILVASSFVMLNLFQTWQLRKGILSGDRMTFAYYWRTFGKTQAIPDDKKLLLINRSSVGGWDPLPNDISFRHRILKSFGFENKQDKKGKFYTRKYAHSGHFSLKMDSMLQFSPAFSIPFKDMTHSDYAWIRVTVWVYPVHALSETPCSLVVTFQHGNGAYKYRAYDLDNPVNSRKLKLDQWNKITVDYLTPEIRRKSDKLVVYIWNRGKKDIYFDDLKVELFNPK
jgi:hypothetical protein